MNDLKMELHALYSDQSKHSSYQNIPDFVSAEFGYVENIDDGWRGDRPRLSFLKAIRPPVSGETWLDFGANTGFFVLSLAHEFPNTQFIAVEANRNHARFIGLVASHFEMSNIEVIQQAIGMRELASLPRTDFMLHLNVLHHAGHDFDRDLVSRKDEFPEYAIAYLRALRERTEEMLFQMGNNWGGNTALPLVGTREDKKKLNLFTSWLVDSGWNPRNASYPHIKANRSIHYVKFPNAMWHELVSANVPDSDTVRLHWETLDQFPGEFYRRPLFHCLGQGPHDFGCSQDIR